MDGTSQKDSRSCQYATLEESLTRRVAELARVSLSPGEIRAYTSQLDRILGYVAQLEKVDVSGIAPLVHPFLDENTAVTPMREDVVVPTSLGVEGLPRTLSSAPEVLESSFKVPPVL